MAIPAKTPQDEAYRQDGPPQGCVAVYRFSNSTGWLSFFVATARYRGHGLGRQLFQAGMDYFHQRETAYIGLDSVAEQRGTYERRGFVETDLVAICERRDAEDVPPLPQREGAAALMRQGERLIDLATFRNWEQLATSDLAHCGLDRSRLWTTEALFHRRDAAGLAVVDQHDGTLKGWVLVRRCELGYRFGPLYAERRDLASLLLHAAMERLEDKDAGLIAEAWHSNQDAVPTFERLGWKWTGTFHRMWYDGRAPAAQAAGGKAETEMYAVFDAAQG